MAINSTGVVADIYTHKGSGKVFFRIDGADLTSCAVTNRYAIDASTDGGKLMFSAILSAKATGAELYVVGSDTCSMHADTEDVNWILYK